MAFGRESVGVELGKEILGREARPHLLLDARDANVADVTVLHSFLPSNRPTTISTRRLEISDVCGAVTTSGLELPRLLVTIRSCGTPSSTRYLVTASARRCATSRFTGSVPVLSEWPPTQTLAFGMVLIGPIGLATKSAI